MQPIDAGYIYELGAIIRPLKGVGYEVTASWQIWSMLTTAREAIQQFLHNSIYSSGLRSVNLHGQTLIDAISEIAGRIEAGGVGKDEPLLQHEVVKLHNAFATFEPVMIAEMQQAPIFYVPPRGAFDNASLINRGEALFPESLLTKVPEALADVQQGARCLAFALPTAAGFHFHRANEAVLRRYFDKVAGSDKRPNVLSMGALLGEMKKLGVDNKSVIAALDNIKEFHRNPLMHPDHTLVSVDEAISLYCAIRSAMSYMLDQLEEIPTVAAPAFAALPT